MYGQNEVGTKVKHDWLWCLMISLRNPLVILLSALAAISFATEDYRAVMSLMIVLGVLLKFIQETCDDSSSAKLKAMSKVIAAVIREGVAQEVPLKHLVIGDIVKLTAGDMIPADIRIISSKDVFVNQAQLTGESLPVEKVDEKEIRDDILPLEFGNVCFLGTSVESGTPTGVVVSTGKQTYKILTVDNDLVTKKVCQNVGLPTEHILVGSEIDKMPDEQLAAEIEMTHIFARLSPADKQHIVQLFRSKDQVVGFMGTESTIHPRCVQQTLAFRSI